jgi:hypothetical protein
VRKRVLSDLIAIAAIGALASFAMRTANSQSIAPLVADVDETTLSELALSYRILVNERVLDAYGHVSIRHPKNPNRFLMARSGEVAPAYVGSRAKQG